MPVQVQNRTRPRRIIFLRRLLLVLSGLVASTAAAEADTVAAPVFSLPSGTYTTVQEVTITSMTSGAFIRYTTDASPPGETAGMLYSGAVRVSANTIIKAIACKGGFTDSPATNATYVIDLPATITPKAPSLTFNSSENVSLSFTASDAGGGTVSKVELYRNGVLDITLNTPALGSTWTFTEAAKLPAGTYTFTGVAYDKSGGATTSTPVTVTVRASLPYLTDFESGEGYVLSSLNQQLGWNVSQGTAMVTSLGANAAHGAWSVVLQPGESAAQVSQSFAPFVTPAGPNIIFVDFFAKPAAETDIATATTFNVGGARFAFTLTGGQGLLQTFNGNGSGGGAWSPTNFIAPLAANRQSENWIELTARLDFTQGTWDLYANGAMVAANQGFLDSTSKALASFSVQGDASTASEIDDILASTDNPLFADANNDGIADSWEQHYNLSTAPGSKDRDLDPTGNGRTVVFDYVNGIDPTDYYAGVLPVLTSLVDARGAPGAQGLVSVKVTRASDGSILANAPITLAVAAGAGQISAAPGGTGSVESVKVLTDANGVASAYMNFTSSASGAALTATAQSGSKSVSLPIKLDAPPSSLTGGSQ
jgi:hypothetical protein